MLLVEHLDGQAVGSHALHFVVQAVVRVRRADEQLPGSGHHTVRLLAQARAHLLAGLRVLDVARNLDVIVLRLVASARCDVAGDARGLHARVSLVLCPRYPVERGLAPDSGGEPVTRPGVAHEHRLRVPARLVRGLVLVALVQDSIRRVFVVPPGVVDRQNRGFPEAPETAQHAEIPARRQPRTRADVDDGHRPSLEFRPDQEERNEPDVSACLLLRTGWHSECPSPAFRTA